MNEERENFVIKRYEGQREWYSKKANSYKKITQLVSVAIVIMSVILPVATSVLPPEWKYRWFPVALSLGIGLATGISGVYRWRELWISYRATEEALKREYSYYYVRAHGYAEADDPVAMFASRIEEILSDEHTKWVSAEKALLTSGKINQHEKGDRK